MTYEPTDLVRHAWQHPPRCIEAFVIKPLELPVGVTGLWEELAVFRVACRCGSKCWRVHGYPHPEADFVCPITLECVGCGEFQLLFDIDKHGYDAEFEHECGSIRGSGEPTAYRCESCAGSRFRVLPTFSYQIEPIDDLGEEVIARTEDFFDGFGLDVVCERCEVQQCVTGYECA